MVGRRAALRWLSIGGVALLAGCRPSLRQRIAEWYVKAQRGPTSDTTETHHAFFRRPYPSPAPLTTGLRQRCDVREETVLGQTVYTLTARRGGSAWHVVYTPGGGFVHPIQKAQWGVVESLIEATGATVTVPLYPLAPEHTHEEAFRELEEVYRALLTRGVAPGRIVLAGDSAGGNLALAQALYYRERGLPLPGRIVLFSPWLDLTLANPDATRLESKDAVLRVAPLRQAGRWWAGTTDPRTPILSPLYGDLRGLPPIQLYVGTHEIFLSDARTLRERVSAAGGRIAYHETPGGFHGFVAVAFTPEAKQVFRQVAQHLAGG